MEVINDNGAGFYVNVWPWHMDRRGNVSPLLDISNFLPWKPLHGEHNTGPHLSVENIICVYVWVLHGANWGEHKFEPKLVHIIVNIIFIH